VVRKLSGDQILKGPLCLAEECGFCLVSFGSYQNWKVLRPRAGGETFRNLEVWWLAREAEIQRGKMRSLSRPPS
jgi:hypothetical protein